METQSNKNIVISYTPLPYQRKLHDDLHRYKILVAGRRVGKTTYAINELIKLSLCRNLPVNYWYVGPYIYQVKQIAWQMLLKYLPRELWAKKPSESELSVKLINGASIALKGSDSPLGLEGIGLGGLVIDEVAAIGHFTSLWQNTLRPMLTDHQAPAIFISKPRGYNWFHDLAKLGDHDHIIEGESPLVSIPDENFVTYRFRSEQNCQQHHSGYLDHSEIESARNQLTPEAFAQEFEAQFTNYTGLVHKPFSREIHIIPDFDPPKEWCRLRGWDFGSASPTASLRVAVDNDNNWFIEHTYKESNKNIEDHVTAIRSQDSDLETVTQGFGDPSGRQWIREFQSKGVPILAARRDENTTEKNWVQLGIDKINGKLQPRTGHLVILPDQTKLENSPSLFILNRPENYALVYELETLVYKETQYGINNAVIDDTKDKFGHFDLLAALRYLAVSETPTVSMYPIPIPSREERQKTLEQKDAAIKVRLKDPEELKKLEHEADMKIIREQQRRNRWW